MSGPRRLLSAADAEKALGIPAATVRSWARRKRIWSYGLDARRDPLYDHDDLIRMRSRSRSAASRVAGQRHRPAETEKD